MSRFLALLFLSGLAISSQGAWYWPFSRANDPFRVPRLSEMMEPATDLIDEASDLAAEGKSQEAVEKYREALLIIDQIEEENPGRKDNPEFATIRNKRAYVNAAIDSLLLEQVKTNARAVAVSDTTALEKRLADERAKKTRDAKKVRKPEKDAPKVAAAPAKQPVRKLTPRERVMADLSRKDYAAASLSIAEMLDEKPNDAVALNLRAALEAAQGNLKAAEATLDQAIASNPGSHFAYYNMSRLKLQQTPPDRSAARRYYETGRSVGGPADAGLEGRLK